MSNEITEQSQQPVKAALTISEYMRNDKVKKRLSEALGNKANIDEFLSNTLIEINRNPELMECSFDSILQCAIDSANFGLIPNKQLGHAYLIPYKNYNKTTKQTTKECQLQFGYKGYIKKLDEAGYTAEVELVTHEEINEGRFVEERGTNRFIKHTPIRTGIRKEEDIALCYVILSSPGKTDIIDVMSIEEIREAAKQEVWNNDTKSKERKLKGVWTANVRSTDFGEMCKKTVIRRVTKKAPIDVVAIMSSYEGERDSKMVDVTPPQDNSKIEDALRNPAPPANGNGGGKLSKLLDKKPEPVPAAVVKENFTTAHKMPPVELTPLEQAIAAPPAQPKKSAISETIMGAIKTATGVEDIAEIMEGHKEELRQLSESERSAIDEYADVRMDALSNRGEK